MAIRHLTKAKAGADTLAEMQSIEVKINPMTANDSYSAWCEEGHDDLVISGALAAWWGENGPKEAPTTSPGVVKGRSKWRMAYN